MCCLEKGGNALKEETIEDKGEKERKRQRGN